MFGRFVQQDQRCVVQESTGDTDAFSLTVRQSVSKLVDLCIVSFRKGEDEVVQRRFLGRADDLYSRSTGFSYCDVIGDTVMEYDCILGHVRLRIAQTPRRYVSDILTAYRDRAFADIPEPQEQFQYRRLSASAGTVYAYQLLRPQKNCEISEDDVFIVCKSDS